MRGDRAVKNGFVIRLSNNTSSTQAEDSGDKLFFPVASLTRLIIMSVTARDIYDLSSASFAKLSAVGCRSLEINLREPQLDF